VRFADGASEFLMKNNALYQAMFPSTSSSPKKFLHGGIMRYLWRPRLWFQHEGMHVDVRLADLLMMLVVFGCEVLVCSIQAIPPGFCRMQELGLQTGQYVGVHIRRGDKGEWRAILKRDQRCVTIF